MIYFSQQIAQMKQIGKSLRSCLSASPSACLAHADYIFMAHADSAESADFASRFALACRLRRVLAWLTQRTQRTQTLQVATLLLPPGCIHSAKRRQL